MATKPLFPRILSNLTYANVMSTLAVFLLLGGTAYAAATLPAKSVGTRELKNNAVTSAQVKDKSLKAADFANGQLPAGARGPAGPMGPVGCNDGLLCPGTDLPEGQRAELTVDGNLLLRVPAYRVDCGAAVDSCVLRVAGPNTKNIELNAWAELVRLGDLAAAKKSFSVSVYDMDGTVIRRYHVTDGYPIEVRDNGSRREGVIKAAFIQRVSV